MSPDDPRHGTTAGWVAHYTHGVLPACGPCFVANSRYSKALRLEHHRGHRRRVPVIGARRRVHALMRMGWPAMEVSRYLGISQQALWESIAPDRKTVGIARHEAIDAVYEALSGTPGPSGRVAKLAASRGYPPPLAWDDIDTDEKPQGHKVCSRPECAGESEALGLCGRHYDAVVRERRRSA